MNRIKRLLKSGGVASAASSLIAIIVGLAFGFIILLVSNAPQAVRGLGIIVSGGFNGGMKGIGQVLYYATPLIMTGLSVGFAFKTGLFNIGAPGQLMVGAVVAVYIGHNATFLPESILWIVALLGAMLAGGIWGAIPGFFKAKLNVNVVIACIMCNYIGMYGVNYMIRSTNLYNQMRNETVSIGQAAIPRWGLDKIFYNLKDSVSGPIHDPASVNGGIIIAIVLAIVIYIILNKTTFGYELKACGYNRHASQYAGINEGRSIMLSMVIAGALAGIGGGLMYLAPSTGLHIRVEEVLSAEGFNGIPVALLGLSNPIGIIFSGLFIAYLTQGGYYLQRLDFMPEIIDIIIAVIIYFSAFSLIVKNLLATGIRRRGSKRAPALDDSDGEEEQDE